MDFKCGSEPMINSEQPSPGSPDRQFCSSTTSAIGEFGNDSNIQDTVKEELPRWDHALHEIYATILQFILVSSLSHS